MYRDYSNRHLANYDHREAVRNRMYADVEFLNRLSVYNTIYIKL